MVKYSGGGSNFSEIAKGGSKFSRFLTSIGKISPPQLTVQILQIKQKETLANAQPPRPNDEPALFRKPSTTNETPHTLGPRLLEDTLHVIKVEISEMVQHPSIRHNLTRKEN